ncbi:MAG: bleomycin resistance family protein [Acidobacteria bacterium]|nr:MAG: bleomycin resistance family protein [Acidobacteriota bacterium]
MTLQPLKAAKPLQATKLTPNLIVSSVERSLAFYTEVLGFARGITVPEESPLAFAAVTSGSVEIFLNDKSTVSKESPQFARLSIGGGGNMMFIEVEDVDPLHERLKSKPNVTIVMPIVTQWYGMREFAIADPDGYVITFAQRVEQP